MFNDLVIRTVEEDDLRDIFRLESKKCRGSYQEFRFNSFKNLELEYDKNGFIGEDFKILVAELDGLVGLIYLSFPREGLARVGLVLDHGRTNRGIGTELILRTVGHIFENYPVERIEADTDVENLRAQRILEKAGFIQEGRLNSYRFHHGEYRDSYIYGLIRRD